MEHKSKSGNVIKDDHIKRVKKLLKNKGVSFEFNVWRDKVEFQITNIRKYKEGWSFTNKNFKYCYEVDIKMIGNAPFPSYYINANKRRLNSRVRSWSNEKILLEELQFFGIDNICISKVQYV
jgi:hypothetical protein